MTRLAAPGASSAGGADDGAGGSRRSREATSRRQAPVLFAGQSLRLGHARAITKHAPFESR